MAEMIEAGVWSAESSSVQRMGTKTPRTFSDHELLNTLDLWVVNRRGEISNEHWLRRHAHEPRYVAQKEAEIDQMCELSGLLRARIERMKELSK